MGKSLNSYLPYTTITVTSKQKSDEHGNKEKLLNIYYWWGIMQKKQQERWNDVKISHPQKPYQIQYNIIWSVPLFIDKPNLVFRQYIILTSKSASVYYGIHNIMLNVKYFGNIFINEFSSIQRRWMKLSSLQTLHYANELKYHIFHENIEI